MMVIIMRDDILETIRDTFEETKNINIQYLLVQQEGDNEVVYGLYTNHIADSISFLHLPENSMETEIDNIKIFMLELGTVLRYIYYHGALNFLYLFHHDSSLMIPSDNFLKLSEYVMENVPLNVGKAQLIFRINKVLDQNISSDDEEMKTYILSLFDHIFAYAFYDRDYQLPDFGHNIHQILDNWNDNNVLIITNYLQDIKQSLEGIQRKKISEQTMNEIDALYIRIQFDSDNI